MTWFTWQFVEMNDLIDTEYVTAVQVDVNLLHHFNVKEQNLSLNTTLLLWLLKVKILCETLNISYYKIFKPQEIA